MPDFALGLTLMGRLLAVEGSELAAADDANEAEKLDDPALLRALEDANESLYKATTRAREMLAGHHWCASPPTFSPLLDLVGETALAERTPPSARRSGVTQTEAEDPPVDPTPTGCSESDTRSTTVERP
jgi:hypothetical protein